MMLRSIKLALATHLLLWGVCRGTPKGTLTQSEFYAASWEVVNSPSTSVTTWGPIEDWDTSGVPSFENAFRTQRNEAGEYNIGPPGVGGGNLKAATFNGDISKWNTTSVKSLSATFRGAVVFNSDLSKWITSSVKSLVATFRGAVVFNSDMSQWITSSVTDMSATFYGASSFTGTGVDLWNINKVKTVKAGFNKDGVYEQAKGATNIFDRPIGLTSCNKRKIADAFKSNTAFVFQPPTFMWSDTCPKPAKLSGGNSPTATTSLVGVVAATAMATAAVCLP